MEGDREVLPQVSTGPSLTRERGPWWREAATLLGVLGLLITLIFNTLAVRQGTKQTKETRETAQISLLTQLNSYATNSERGMNDTPAPQNQCNPFVPLSPPDEAAVRAALDYYEYLAWLFNHRRLTVTNSRPFFGSRMIVGWRLARHYLGQDRLSHVYPELTRFVHDTPRGDRPPSVCPN
jgi:hypothetical protein